MDRVKRIVLIGALICVSNLAEADYTVGDGFEVGNIFVSGYTKLAWESPTGKSQKIVLDDLSLFASASINDYFNPFIEAEIATAELWKDGDGVGFRQSKLVLERLYNDIHLNDEITLRLGKSLAPVGEWNRIHAAPLVWTTSRPVTTRYSFSESISGLNLQYTRPNNDSFHIYAQPSSEWAPKPYDINRPRYYENVYGISFDTYFALDTKFGVAIQHAKVKGTGDKQWVFSLDGQWKSQHADLEFQTTFAEINFKQATNLTQNEIGGYFQGVWHFNEQWHAVVRPEYFRSRIGESQSSMLYGMIYQPQPAISLKLEYVDTHRQQSFGLTQGLFGSLAVLF